LAEELEAFWLSLAANYQAGNARERPVVLGVERAILPHTVWPALGLGRPNGVAAAMAERWRWSEWRVTERWHRCQVRDEGCQDAVAAITGDRRRSGVVTV
jgi:hypothetical protein